MKPCEQYKCTLRSLNKCPACRCGAKPHTVNPACEHCWACENDEGYIRDSGTGLPEDAKIEITITRKEGL